MYMKGYQIKVDGNWGHFKKPETNNNPLSHDLITKTALIGLIGAVLGIERKEMKEFFPVFSDDLLYGVELLNSVRKISWGFTSVTAVRPSAPGTPKYFEFLKYPSFKVCIALQNERSQDNLTQFIQSVKDEESIFPPVLGWHNCPANLSFISEGEFTRQESGFFETKGFANPKEHQPTEIEGDFRIGFEKLPTFQDNDFWNLPERYKDVIYPDASCSLKLKGEHFSYKGQTSEKKTIEEQWWLI